MAKEVCKDPVKNLFDQWATAHEINSSEGFFARMDALDREELEAVKEAARRFLYSILAKPSTQAHFSEKEGDRYGHIAEERLTSINRSLRSCRTARQVMRVVYERGVLWQVPPKTNRNLIRRIY